MLGKRMHRLTTAILLAGSALAIFRTAMPLQARDKALAAKAWRMPPAKPGKTRSRTQGKKVYTDDDVKPAAAGTNPAPADRRV